VREGDRQADRYGDDAALADGLQCHGDSLADFVQSESARGVNFDGGSIGRKRARVDRLRGREGRGRELVRLEQFATSNSVPEQPVTTPFWRLHRPFATGYARAATAIPPESGLLPRAPPRRATTRVAQQRRTRCHRSPGIPR
jgi:hypothetical protein